MKNMKEILKDYSYHLPSSDTQLKEFTREIKDAILHEVFSGIEGIVINGILEGGITKKNLMKIKEKLDEDLN